MMLHARIPLVSRALKRAIAYCNQMREAEMNSELPGVRDTPTAIAWRREGVEYRALLEKLEPKPKGAPR
jgi:hypothetical protein